MRPINRIKVLLVEKQRTGKWLAEQLERDPATVFQFLCNYGVTRQALTKTQILNMNIPSLSLSKQQEIVNRVESLFAKADAVEAKYQALKQQIDKLPQAILHKAFKGELVEQFSTDGNARDLLKEIEKLNKSIKKK